MDGPDQGPTQRYLGIMGCDNIDCDEPCKVGQRGPLFLVSFGSVSSGGNLPEYDPENQRKSNAFNSFSGKSSENFTKDPS
jgi:hypothetical protein